jgi:rare lipoprotein A
MIQINNPLKMSILLFCSFIFLLKSFAQDSTKAKQPSKHAQKTTGHTLFGQASFYSNKFEGRRTANGETFSQKKFTAACNSLPLGTWIEVTNLRNNKTVIVKTNDRLHPSMKRVVDLTYAAAKKLDFISAGLTKVKVVVLNKKLRK